MLTRTSTSATRTGRMSAALGMLLCARACITAAAGGSSADAMSTGTPLYGYFHAQRTADFDETRRRSDDPTRIFFDAETTQSAGLAAVATGRVRARARALTAQ